VVVDRASKSALSIAMTCSAERRSDRSVKPRKSDDHNTAVISSPMPRRICPARTFGPVLAPADDYSLSAAPGRSVRHAGGMQDEIINQIGVSVLQEMKCPTAAGRMLVDTSSLLLAARLVHAHSETGLIRPPIQSRHRLDERRLRRVLAFVEEHLAEEITVADLANVACLSLFHFTRAFAATMGVPPHRYVGQRRLESAKVMIAADRMSFDDIAHASRFSSQWSFARAFRRATGMTPAEYRRTLR
jgi:AraC family transcriptional regulator